MNFTKLKLNKDLIRRPLKDSQLIVKKDVDFMSGLTNQAMAEAILQGKIDDGQFNYQEEFIEYARRRGYLKTEMDRKIVEHLLIKNKETLTSNEMEYIKTKQGDWLRKKRIRAIVETATKNNPELVNGLEKIIKEEYKLL